MSKCHYLIFLVIVNFVALCFHLPDELDFFRCMVNGESVLETLQSEKDSFSTERQDYVDNEELSKAYGHLSKALKYCDELPKEKYVSPGCMYLLKV